MSAVADKAAFCLLWVVGGTAFLGGVLLREYRRAGRGR